MASFLGEPAVAITRAPACTPSWTAAEPAPPAPACTSNVSPSCRPPRSYSASQPRWKGIRIPAAAGSWIESGTSKVIAVGAVTYSAYPPNAPLGIATTRRPAHASAPGPHASTVPITSMPGMYGIGVRTVLYRPWMPSRSLKFSVIASTRISTSLSPGVGISTSSGVSTSAGAPYSCTRHARITRRPEQRCGQQWHGGPWRRSRRGSRRSSRSDRPRPSPHPVPPVRRSRA